MQEQVTQAVSRRDWYDKWGRHYLPSLARAHLLQRCNNFKDPGVQFYGGRSFMALRDKLDAVFCALPAPKPSVVKSADVLGLGAGGRPSSPPPLYSMASYHSSGNPCFDGACLVRMADGSTERRVDALKRGDLLYHPCTSSTSTSPRAKSSTAQLLQPSRVLCVVKTPIRHGKVRMVQLPGGLRITPYHPVRVAGTGSAPQSRFVFPVDLAPAKEYTDCEAVYSFVLDQGHMMQINGVDCVTWAHGFTEGAAAHPFFGTEAVLHDLQRGDPKGFASGLIVLNGANMARDPTTGLIVSLFGNA
jgi:hypothetical protein